MGTDLQDKALIGHGFDKYRHYIVLKRFALFQNLSKFMNYAKSQWSVDRESDILFWTFSVFFFIFAISVRSSCQSRDMIEDWSSLILSSVFLKSSLSRSCSSRRALSSSSSS